MMRAYRISKSPIIIAALVGTLAANIAPGAQQSLPRRSATPVEQLPGLLYKTPLNPVLRSGVQQARFSSNGTYILVQDAASVYVMTRQPLALLFWLPALEALPARFSTDSNALIIASTNGVVGRWSLPTGQPLGQKRLDIKQGCLRALLSRDGELFACAGLGLDLHVYRVSSGDQIFSDALKNIKLKAMHWYSIPRPHGSPFSEPIGYSWARSPKLESDPTNSSHQMDFSPDNKFFLIADPNRGAPLLVDLAANRKSSLVGSLRRKLDAGMLFVTPGKIIAFASENQQKLALLLFPGGHVLEQLPIAGTPISAASNTRYLIFRQPGVNTVAAFDLELKSVIQLPPEAAIDIYGEEIIGVSSEGTAALLRPGETQPQATLVLPRAPLADLRVAAIFPGLHTLILSSEGQAGLWDATSGNRLRAYSPLEGAWCEEPRSCYLKFPRQANTPAQIEKLVMAPLGAPAMSGVPVTPASQFDSQQRWTTPVSGANEQPPDQDVASGPVILHITRHSSQALPYNSILQALDITSGKLLWSRVLESGIPVPFADPQGDRVVFAWRAESPGARAAAARNPVTREFLQKANLQAQDSFFEVVDARSGKTLGGAVVQSAAGPERFDSAFSSGDWLVSSRDGNRLIVYSISTGEEKGRTFGRYPAIASETGLLALTDGAETLTLYDLSEFRKRATYRFPNPVAYLHFAADGRRLFVLTTNQVAYVLDVSQSGSSQRLGFI